MCSVLQSQVSRVASCDVAMAAEGRGERLGVCFAKSGSKMCSPSAGLMSESFDSHVCRSVFIHYNNITYISIPIVFGGRGRVNGIRLAFADMSRFAPKSDDN